MPSKGFRGINARCAALYSTTLAGIFLPLKCFQKGMETKALTVLSYGAGQDSTAILYRIVLDPAFGKQWVKGNFIVVMSNTGNEHPHTYRHVAFIQDFCLQHGIQFFFLSFRNGYHPNTWPTLQGQYLRNDSIMSLAYPKSCTDNLKIKPIYNFLDHFVAQEYYGYSDKKIPTGKKFIKQFAKDYGKIYILLGIAAGEESRVNKLKNKKMQHMQLNLFEKQMAPSRSWMDISIERLYPLIETGMDREACQEYIRSTGLPLPFPSNCMFCPFASKVEILWLFRNYPAAFRQWVTHEQRKLQKSAAKGVVRNLGVKGDCTLEEFLQEAIVEFGHMTDDQLNDYKMSHGHCVKSTF